MFKSWKLGISMVLATMVVLAGCGTKTAPSTDAAKPAAGASTAVSAVPSATAPAAPASAAPANNYLTQVKASGKLKVGWGEWKPLEYIDPKDNKHKGLLITMAENVATGLGVKPDFIQDQWSNLATGVTTGKFDISIMGITQERSQLVEFSKPLYQTDMTAIVAKDSPRKHVDEVLGSADETIAVTTGSNTDQSLMQLEKEGKLKAKVLRIQTVADGVLALSSKRATVYTDQKDALLGMIESNQGKFKLLDGAYAIAPFAIAVPKNKPEFKAAIDVLVVQMIKDGSVDKLLKEYNVNGTYPSKAD